MHKIIKQLEKSLKLKILIKETKVKLELDTLDIGIGLKNVNVIDEKSKISLKIIKAKEVYCSLGLIGLLKSKYIINHIKISDGNLKIDLANEGISKQNINPLPINLNNIIFKNIHLLIFDSENKKNEYDCFARKLKFNFFPKNKLLNGKIDGNIFLKKIRQNNNIIFKNSYIDLDINFLYNYIKEKLTLNPSSILKINKAPISVNGNVNIRKGKNKININLKSIKNINLLKLLFKDQKDKGDKIKSEKKLQANLTSKRNLLEKIKKHLINGFTSFDLNIKNTIENPIIIGKINFPVLSLNVDNTITNLNLKEVKTNLNLKSFKELSLNKIDVDIEEGRFGKGKFKTKFKVIDFEKLNCLGEIIGNIESSEVLALFTKTSQVIADIKGDLNFDLKFDILLDSIIKKKCKKAPYIDGEIDFTNISLFKNGIKIEDIKGKIPINESNIENAEILMHINKDDFSVNISIKDFFEFLTINENKTKVNIKILAQTLDFYNLLSQYSNSKKDQKQTARKIKIPASLIARLECKINKMKSKKLLCEDVYLKARIYDQVLFIDRITAKTSGGKFEIDGFFDLLNSYPVFKGKGKLTRIYINQILKSFDNFNQKFISYKNLKGELFSNFDFTIKLDNYGRPFWNTLDANIEFYIKDGLLYNFKPLYVFNRYIDEKQLNHIYFEKPIKNKIYINSSKIFIPKVFLKSSVIDILLSGWHSFDNKIHYVFILPLKGNLQIDKKNKNQRNKRNLRGSSFKAFVKVDGTIKKPKISFDISIEEKAKIKPKQLEHDEYFNF